MNLLNFVSQFPDEESCKIRWKEFRDEQGVVCPKCGHTRHYWKSDKECCESKQCKYHQSFRSNTVMHDSQLPFRYCFVAMHLLTSTRKSFLFSELQDRLGHKFYEPVWALLNKLLLAMGKRDEKYELSRIIKMDEGFFSTEILDDEKNKPVKRGRGCPKKVKYS